MWPNDEDSMMWLKAGEKLMSDLWVYSFIWAAGTECNAHWAQFSEQFCMLTL